MQHENCCHDTRSFLHSQTPRKRKYGTPRRATRGGTRVGQEAEGERLETHARAFIVVSVGKARQGRASRLRTGSGLCSIGAAPGFLIPGPGVVRPGVSSSVIETGGDVDLGLAGFHMEGTLAGKWLPSLGISWPWMGWSFQDQQVPGCQFIRKYRK